MGSAPSLGAVAIEKGAFGSPSTRVANFTYSWFEFSVFLQRDGLAIQGEKPLFCSSTYS